MTFVLHNLRLFYYIINLPYSKILGESYSKTGFIRISNILLERFYLNNFIGYHAVTWHSVKFDIVWLKLVLTRFHFHFPLHYVWCHNEVINFILTWFHLSLIFFNVFLNQNYELQFSCNVIFTCNNKQYIVNYKQQFSFCYFS
jgi:hypothetical protein